MVKYRGNVPATELVRAAADDIGRSGDQDLQLVIDVDPYMMM